MSNLLNNKYLKIFLLILAAFIFSDFSIKNIFLANSPRLNPLTGQIMIAKVNFFWSKTTNLIALRSNLFNLSENPKNNSVASNNSSNPIESLPQKTLNAVSTPLKKVSQGVYAGERNGIQVYEIRSNEIDYLQYTFMVNGKEVKIKVAKDQQPPTQSEMDVLFK